MQSPNDEFQNLDQVIQYILKVHHNYLWREMGPLESLVKQVAVLHGSRDERLHDVQRLFSAMIEDLGWHLRREENIVFPRILALEKGQDLDPDEDPLVELNIGPMAFEHRGAEAVLAEMRLLTQDYQAPEYACHTYLAMLRQLEHFEMDMVEHIRLEDEVLFPRSLALAQSRG
jgi:regulator of cell morphogenesis and NO signaling